MKSGLCERRRAVCDQWRMIRNQWSRMVGNKLGRVVGDECGVFRLDGWRRRHRAGVGVWQRGQRLRLERRLGRHWLRRHGLRVRLRGWLWRGQMGWHHGRPARFKGLPGTIHGTDQAYRRQHQQRPQYIGSHKYFVQLFVINHRRYSGKSVFVPSIRLAEWRGSQRSNRTITTMINRRPTEPPPM